MADAQTDAAKRAAELRGAEAAKVGGQRVHRGAKPAAAKADADGEGDEPGGNELNMTYKVHGKWEL